MFRVRVLYSSCSSSSYPTTPLLYGFIVFIVFIEFIESTVGRAEVEAKLRVDRRIAASWVQRRWRGGAVRQPTIVSWIVITVLAVPLVLLWPIFSFSFVQV